MSPWVLYAVAIAYTGVAIQYAMNGRYGMAMAFAAYAVSNIGFAWDLR